MARASTLSSSVSSVPQGTDKRERAILYQVGAAGAARDVCVDGIAAPMLHEAGCS